MKASSLLGLNARAQISYKYNRNWGKLVANSKIKTHKVLKKAEIPTPAIYKIFTKPKQALLYDWSKLPDSFALKPSKGLGGEGIIVVKKRSKDGMAWITTSRKRLTAEDLKLHTLDIFEGAYSMHHNRDVAFVQEYIGRHKAFRKFAYRGTPDIRIVVFNKVPIMAMLRLPTKDSGGRANLHQGAIAAGIDIATGITTSAIWYGASIKFKPGTKRKLNGIRIPHWTKILETAVKCSIATRLGFVGVDVVLHPEKGPMILEVNAQPGFQIQLANEAGLKKRIDRVEDLEIRDAEHAVKIAKALFSTNFAYRVKQEDGAKTVSVHQEITIKGNRGKRQRRKAIAKLDTGAWRTSISEHLARELGLLDESNILWTKNVKSSLGIQERPIVSLTFWMGGRKIVTPASVAKRITLKYPVIIGRKDLKGFLVDPLIAKEDIEKRKQNESSTTN